MSTTAKNAFVESIASVPASQLSEVVELEHAAIPPVSPEEAFGNHVAFVREQGDVHIRNEAGNKARVLGFAGMAACFNVMTVTGEQNLDKLGPMTVYPVVMLVGSIGGSAYHRAAGNYISNKRSFDAEAQQKLGERYDLYLGENDDVVLHWRGTLADDEAHVKPVDESLRTMAELAQQHDIHRVLVDAPLVNAIIMSKPPAQTLKAWYQQEYDVKPIRELADVSVVSMTPVGLIGLAERSLLPEPKQIVLKHIEALRECDPLNPVIQAYDTYKTDPQLLLNKLKIRLRDALNTMSLEGDQAIPKSTDRFRDRGADSTTSLHGNKVFTFTADSFTTRSLAGSLDMSPEAIDRILANPTSNPTQYKKLLYMLLYQEAHGIPTEQIVDTEKTSQLLPFKAELEQPRLTRRYRLGRALGAVMTTATLIAGAAAGVMLDVHEYSITSVADVTYDSTLQRTDSRETAFAARQQVLGQHPGSSLYVAYENKLAAIDAWLVKHTGDGADHSGAGSRSAGEGVQLERSLYDQQTFSGVGNIDPTHTVNEPAWYIQGHGIDTAGYWASGVSSAYVSNKASGSWLTDYNSPQIIEIPTTLPPDSTQYIKVNRPINSGNSDVPAMVNVPVLEGMRPAAANVGGQPVTVSESANGTYSIVGDESWQDGQQLMYWLVPDAKARPHAVNPSEIVDSSEEPLTPVAAAIAWKNVLGNLPDNDVARADAEINYIRKNFEYRFSPINMQALQKRSATHPEFVKLGGYTGGLIDYELSVGKRANCNVANTLVALDNSQLNAVVGYHNHYLGYGPDMLSTGEAHLWLTDGAGHIIDATPTKLDPTEPGTQDLQSEAGILQRMNQVASASREQEIALDTVSVGALLLAAGYGAVGLRRLRTRRAKQTFSNISADELALTAASVEQVLYAREFRMASVQRRAQSYKTKPQEMTVKLEQPAFHSKQLRKQVGKVMPRGRDRGSVTRTLQLARRANQNKTK